MLKGVVELIFLEFIAQVCICGKNRETYLLAASNTHLLLDFAFSTQIQTSPSVYSSLSKFSSALTVAGDLVWLTLVRGYPHSNTFTKESLLQTVAVG